MNPKKTKEKERRRARKLADEAWAAADQNNLDLAEKIIRRAVATQPDNPVLWNDQGMILSLRSKDDDAEKAFRTAISLAPSYAEPFTNLAAMRARQGCVRDAIHWMEKAIMHAPQTAAYVDRLEAYRALVQNTSQLLAHPMTAEEPAPKPDQVSPAVFPRVASLDWQELSRRLTREGWAVIPALVDPSTCAELRCRFDDDTLFAKTVVMDRDEFGKGVYRYFKPPLPSVVDSLRRAVYPHVASIANDWQRLLCEIGRFPDDWEGFRVQCQKAGQTMPTPILLKYGTGGFNGLHRDLRGAVYFPIQMAVVLSPLMDLSTQAEGFRGGEFLFCDVPEGTKSRRRAIPAGMGDALLFCTRDRLVCVGGAYGLQPVKHGVNQITEGTRFVLGVPFHEYR